MCLARQLKRTGIFAGGFQFREGHVPAGHQDGAVWHTGKAGTDPLGAQAIAFSDSFDQSVFYISFPHFQVSSVCVTVGDGLSQNFLVGKFHCVFSLYGTSCRECNDRHTTYL